MRVLIDTNILIYREDDRVLTESMQRLLLSLQETGSVTLVHPFSYQELEKDKDEERREVILSKIRAYHFLEAPPDPTGDDEYLGLVGRVRRHKDKVDNAILYAVYKDAVDFLITEDRGIHKKALRLGLEDRVLPINDALLIFERYLYKGWVVTPPALKEEYAYNINWRDPIFDSLRNAYDGFEDWSRKISREGRKCLAYRKEDGCIGALLIHKIEDEPIGSNPPLVKKKRLKLSTLKVAYAGHKIGELFIKLSVNIAIKNDITEIYLTHFPEPMDRLVELITEYGFYKAAVNNRGEDIFLKRLVVEKAEAANMSPTEIAKKFYPSYYDGALVKKFIVPIRPEYHNRLFTDFSERQLTLIESAGNFIIEGNTISKAYICHSKAKKIRAGDIVIFYLSGRKIVTTVGIVESVDTGKQESYSILRRVGKRTVYSLAEIEEMAKKFTMVILFRQHFHLIKTVSLGEMKAMGVLSGAPQSILQISDESYANLKKKGGIDERFTIH